MYRRFDEYDRSGITGPVEDPPGGGDPLPPRILGQKWLDITWAWDPSASLAQLITGFEVGVAVGTAPGQDPWLVAPFTVPASDRRAVRAVSLASDLTTAHACVRPLYGAQAGPWTVQGVAQSVVAVPVALATRVLVDQIRLDTDAAAAAAATAQTAANSANAALADIAADGKLTPIEKHQARQEWDVIAAEKVVNDTQATTFGITTEKTAYGTAFQALATYLNAGTTWASGVPSWLADANLATTTVIVGSTFRSTWKAYYDARTALLNAIAAKAKSLADAAQTTGTNAGTAAAAAQTAATNAQTTANTAVTNAATANTALADIAADSKLTPLEKHRARQEWDVIAAEKAGIDSQADTFAQSRTTYDAAFQALATYLNAGTTWASGVPSWLADANLATTTVIVGSTFRSTWKAYYDARTALLNAIAAKAKSLADAAQTTGTNAGTAAAAAQAAANNAASAAAYADRLARSGHNMIKNGNSEDPDPTGWEAAWISDSGAYTGTRCRALTVADAGGRPQTIVGEEPCDPGDQFVFSAWGKQATASSKQYIFIEFLNAAGARTGIKSKVFPASTAYTQVEVSDEAPAGTVKVRFVIYVGQADATTYYWDCLYAARKVSAGMLEADILKALLVLGEVIETPNYVPGSAGVAPVGVKISGVPFAATLKDGSTLQVNMELGTSASIGGERVQTILDALFANQAEFQAGQSGTWTAPKSGWLEVLMCGGGGSGAHSTDDSFPVCGGGGAGVLKYTIWVAKGQQIPYSVGSGGLGGTDAMGNNGGDTTFGAATAKGGKGGKRGGATAGGPGGAVIPPTSLGGQIAGAAAGVSTSITTGFDVLAACPGAGGGNAITYGGGTTWFAPWTSGNQGTGGSSGLGRGGQSGTAPTGYGAGSGARKNTSSASLPGGPGYLRLRW